MAKPAPVPHEGHLFMKELESGLQCLYNDLTEEHLQLDEAVPPWSLAFKQGWGFLTSGSTARWVKTLPWQKTVAEMPGRGIYIIAKDGTKWLSD
eukprot:8899390-Lingulodinium_polyedra.AAC.1